jgi:hypothetical protein
VSIKCLVKAQRLSISSLMSWFESCPLTSTAVSRVRVPKLGFDSIAASAACAISARRIPNEFVDLVRHGVVDHRKDVSVDVTGDTARRMTHALLEDVIGRTQGDNETGSRVPEPVERKAFESGFDNGRAPDAVAEVAGMERPPVGPYEDELIRIRPPPSQQMLGEHAGDEAGHRDDRATGGGLHIGEGDSALDFGESLERGEGSPARSTRPTLSPATSDQRRGGPHES